MEAVVVVVLPHPTLQFTVGLLLQSRGDHLDLPLEWQTLHFNHFVHRTAVTVGQLEGVQGAQLLVGRRQP